MMDANLPAVAETPMKICATSNACEQTAPSKRLGRGPLRSTRSNGAQIQIQLRETALRKLSAKNDAKRVRARPRRNGSGVRSSSAVFESLPHHADPGLFHAEAFCDFFAVIPCESAKGAHHPATVRLALGGELLDKIMKQQIPTRLQDRPGVFQIAQRRLELVVAVHKDRIETAEVHPGQIRAVGPDEFHVQVPALEGPADFGFLQRIVRQIRLWIIQRHHFGLWTNGLNQRGRASAPGADLQETRWLLLLQKGKQKLGVCSRRDAHFGAECRFEFVPYATLNPKTRVHLTARRSRQDYVRNQLFTVVAQPISREGQTAD